jgi:hypothetical protein
VMEIADGLIQYHRVYWGWCGTALITSRNVLSFCDGGPGPRSHHSLRDGFDNWSGARGACNRSREVLHEPGVANLTRITAFSFCGYPARAECV